MSTVERTYIIHSPLYENDQPNRTYVVKYQIVKVYDCQSDRALEVWVDGVDFLNEVIEFYRRNSPDVYVCQHDLFEDRYVWDSSLDIVETIDRGRYPTSKQYARTSIC